MQHPSPSTTPAAAPSARRRVAALLGSCLLVAQGLATLWLVTPQACAQTPIVIQFSHVVTADTAKGRAALKFKELAEARSNGRVRVEVYPNSLLYKDREEIEALRLGAVQMLAPSLSKLAGVGGTDFEAFDLPFLFPDHAAYRRVVDGPLGAELLHRLEASGLKGLAYWDNGFKVFTANRPLQGVQDFKGLKIRVQASRTLVKQMQQLGAEPSISPLINVFDALRSGKLDGQENTPVNIASQHLHDVQSHLTVSNHGYLAYAVVVNKAFWDKLPADIRSTLEAALRDATAFENGLAESENSKALERIKASGKLSIYTPGAQELAAWRAALDPVALAAQSGIQPELVRALQAATRAPP
ncbi:MAG: DctP family TRAP transporter solute-binding subunit [Rhodoferax sp.]|nr:DctP family TRAP transporter solute-binding subunit [Rhodoferax sp.]